MLSLLHRFDPKYVLQAFIPKRLICINYGKTKMGRGKWQIKEEEDEHMLKVGSQTGSPYLQRQHYIFFGLDFRFCMHLMTSLKPLGRKLESNVNTKKNYGSKRIRESSIAWYSRWVTLANMKNIWIASVSVAFFPYYSCFLKMYRSYLFPSLCIFLNLNQKSLRHLIFSLHFQQIDYCWQAFVITTSV